MWGVRKPIAVTHTHAACALCACIPMVSTVACLNSVRIMAWMRASLSGSTLAVASSIRMILELRSSARAMHSSCRWPRLTFLPPCTSALQHRVTAASTKPAANEQGGDTHLLDVHLKRELCLGLVGAAAIAATLGPHEPHQAKNFVQPGVLVHPKRVKVEPQCAICKVTYEFSLAVAVKQRRAAPCSGVCVSYQTA